MTESLFSSHEAESYKKKISLREDINLSTMELSGTVIKQGYLAKQVWLPWGRMDSSQPQGRWEFLKGWEGLRLPAALIISRMSHSRVQQLPQGAGQGDACAQPHSSLIPLPPNAPSPNPAPHPAGVPDTGVFREKVHK